ncbi:MAG TPA: hypothetical protein PLE30_05870 [Candidatus Kapabacteria bacterium]|nr:hypothetical protein [Candidatus Kapabacteria bacterium]
MFCFQNSYSQEESPELILNINKIDSLILSNTLEYGLSKQQNIYDYFVNISYNQSGFINFNISNAYNGNTLSSNENLNKDNEQFMLYLNKEIINNFKILSQSNYILLNYPGSSGTSKIERINNLFGVEYYNSKQFLVSLLTGPESNSQIGYTSSGINSKLNLMLNNFSYENFLINFINKIDLLSLDNNRNNKDVVLSTNLSKIFDNFDRMYFDINYNLMDRFYLSKMDSLYKIANNLVFDYSIENRLSKMYNANVRLDFLLFDKLQSYLGLSYNLSNVTKSFNEFAENDNRTGIVQNRNFQKFNIDFKIEYNGNINQKLAINYDNEIEENSVINKFNINHINFKNYENMAFDLNFEQSIFKVMGTTSFKVNTRDSIRANYSSSIKRFDTPSLTNNSDRDELLSMINLDYYIKLSRVFEMVIDAEVQFYHQVNLKSSLSASNYQMRTLKFGPQFNYKTNNFYMRPNLSILANYITYDFENQNQSIRSYSIRQINYNDSLEYKFEKYFSLSAKLDIIYKETGILYWKDFEELPINGNLRFFSKFLITNFQDIYHTSIGFRYYNLSLNNFSNFVGNYTNLSYGPEVALAVNFSTTSRIEFNGWYEFQFVNNKLVNEIPNFFIRTSILL